MPDTKNLGLLRLLCIMVDTKYKIMKKEGFSLTNKAMSRNAEMLKELMREVANAGKYVDFINGYAYELFRCIEDLLRGEHWDEADIAAAEAIPELNGQLVFVKEAAEPHFLAALLS